MVIYRLKSFIVVHLNVLINIIISEKDICGYNIQLGCSIRPIASSFDEFKADFKRKNYALIPDESTKTIYGVFREECSPKEMLESYALAVFSALLANGSVLKIFL